MPKKTPSRTETALQEAAAIADSVLYLTDAALAAGPDYESGAYLVALQALGERLKREVAEARG